MRAVPAVPGLGFDCSAKVTDRLLTAAQAAGYSFGVRYSPLPGLNAAGDCDRTEVARFLAAKLPFMLVQHVRFPGWNPADHSGSADGIVAATYARSLDYPKKAHLWLDLEGLSPASTIVDTLRFCNNWSDVVHAAGYQAGLYVGYDDRREQNYQPLSPDQLYALPGFNSYWSDAGHRKVSTRGCAIQQRQQITLAGVPIDPDALAADAKGETPYWAVADAA